MLPADDDDHLVSSVIGKYRLLRKLGEGGMGSVYLAERTEDFEQQVALKLILEGLHEETTLNRFRIEQQALAALQHPNIVQMVDAGESENGIPYLAMDYVDGEPLDIYCDRLCLTVRERIEIFLQVLEAVEYAHRRFLIHCDLKFSNILVTAHREARLLDFGVTKLLQPELFALDSGVTKATLRPFTPEFASPEQLKLGVLTTATDIYSAGVVLYQLLCGVHPFEPLRGDPVKLLRAICDQDPVAMSSHVAKCRKTNGVLAESVARQRSTKVGDLVATLTGDLDAILGKTLRKEPEERYENVAQLAADLRRYLANQPVLVRNPSPGYRFAKFLRRNRTLAIASAAVLLAVALGAGAWLSQFWRAHQSRVLATSRFADVRQLTNALLFDFYDAVAKLPGATPAQENLVRWSLSYLDDLSRRDSSDPTLRLELAESYRKLGNLLGNPYENNLGKPDDAIATLTKGLLVIEPRTEADRAASLSRDAMLTMARLYGSRSEVRWMANQTELCLKDGAESLRQFDKLAEQYPKDAQIQMETAAKHEAYADLFAGAYQVDFDVKTALKHLQIAMDYGRRAIAADPTYVRPYRALGIFQMKVADAVAYDDPEEAITEYQEAAKLFDQVPSNGQNELATKRARRSLVFRSAWSYSALGRYREAIAMYRSVIEDHREGIRLDPENERVHWDYAVLMRQLAEAHFYAGEWAEALEGFTECTETMKGFFEGGIKGERRAAYGEAMVYRGTMLARLGRSAEAERFTARGLAVLKEELAVADAGESLLQRAAEAFIVALPARFRDPGLALDLLDRRIGTGDDSDAFQRLLRAEALAAAGKTAEAVKEAKKALASTTRKANVNNWNRLQAVAALGGKK
jgi:serine/threonine protein kinase